MSAPKRHDAAIRWTKDGQDYIHYAGARLRNLAPGRAQNISRFDPASPSGSPRVIEIGTSAAVLEASLVYDGQQYQLEQMLADAVAGATLEYFPSLSNPSESYPCILDGAGRVELAQDPDFWHEYRYQARVRLRRIDGGNWLGLTSGSLFYYTAGNPLPGLTFTRSGTAMYVDEDGLLQEAAENIFRTTWQGGTPRLLLEAGSTNVYDFSDDLTDASWSKVRASAAQNSGITNPEGVASASSGVYALIEDSATGQHYLEQVLPTLGDNEHEATSFWVRRSSHTHCYIQTIDKASRADRTWFDLASGTVDTTDADHVMAHIEEGPVSGAFRWYRVSVVWDSGSGGTTPRALLGMATADGVSSYAGDGSSQMFVWNPQFEVGASVPSSDIVTDSAANESRGAEAFYANFPHAPQAMTGYVKFTPYSNAIEGLGAVLQIGSATGSEDPRLVVDIDSSGRYRLTHDNATASVQSVLSASPAYGQEVELLLVLNADGSVQISQSIEGAAATSGSASSALALAGAWAAERLYLNTQGATIDTGLNAFESVKFLPGVKTLAEMRTT